MASTAVSAVSKARKSGGAAAKSRVTAKKAAALFRVWDGVRDLISEAEQLGDAKLVEFLNIASLLVEEKITSGGPRSAKVGSQAYQLNAKARALLRGKEIVARDLSTSGGAYSLEQVQSLLHDITRQAVNKRVRDGSLLAVPGPSNRLSYPVVQFTDGGTPVEGLKEVREALGTENSWMILNFLVSPDSKLGNRTPIDLMKAGKLQRVLEVARRFGVQGA